MTVRIGINGFGRIGRSYLRAALASNADVDVVAVNDLTDGRTLASLLEWDSINGRLDGVGLDGDAITLGDKRIRVFAQADPAGIAWGEVGADVVIEATGFFADGVAAAAHLKGGARKVIVSAPAKGDVPTFVLGVNDDTLDVDGHDVFSNGSCTTNSLAPLAKVLHDAFGIESGLMTTIHAYTGDQRLHDAPHSDLRRARAAAVSTIPTSSGAAKAIGKVIPELDGRLTGAALRVPVPVGSITDLTVALRQRASVAEVNAAFREAAASERLRRYLQYSEAPLVSADIVGNPYSSIFDAPLTESVGHQVKVMGWYDNEWGFSNRLVEFSERIGTLIA
ncbi:type I glyceraldehyde-3-phosphate dehydrogenase [Actinoplanes sp. NPDC051851]|uniref:type I glyceraldehyde-3-phosphate dehydrogenase n=1 Tax=Actinoplanes sp. NPDC051851 TaxID=3154753 RepID=UPI00342A396F